MKEHARSLDDAHMVQATLCEMLKAVKSYHQNYSKPKERKEAERRQLQLIAEKNALDQCDKEQCWHEKHNENKN